MNVGTQSGGNLRITPPFTVQFDITRSILTSANVCSLRIYNLSENNRNQLRFNFYNTGELRPIEFQAGYGTTNLPIVFTGNITEASSVREGKDFITTIQCFDGGFAFANAITNLNFPDGTAQNVILEALVNSLDQYGVAPGAIGSYPGSISRGNAYSGSTTDILAELTNGGFFIDNGKANCLGNSECVEGGIAVINAKSGLLNTPVLQQTILTFDMLFEPGVIAGQQIQLQSLTEQNYNGFYKVLSIHHVGMISPSVCGDAVTSLGMYYGAAALTDVGIL